MATQADQTNTGVVTTIVVVGTFAMITISAMLTALVRSEHEKLDSERPTNADLETVAALEQQQLARINAPASWVSQPGGKVNIPIARAMSVVVEEYRKNPAAASPPAPPGVNMTPAAPDGQGAAPAGQAPAGQPPAGQAPGTIPPGTPQPAPAVPSPAAPNPAAPDSAETQRVVPPPAAPGPPATPAPAPGPPPVTPPPGGGH